MPSTNNAYKSYVEPISQNRFVKSYAPYIFNVVALIIFVLFALRPTIVTISNLQKNIQENQSLLDSIKQKSQQIEQGRDNLKKISPEVREKIKTALPANPAVTGLVTSLQSSSVAEASISALQIQPVTLITIPESTSSGTVVAKVDFSFNTSGSYQQAYTTVENLLKSARVLTIDNLSMSKREDNPIILSVSGTATYLK